MHEPPERRIALHRGFIDVAVRRGVERIAYLSFIGAGAGGDIRGRISYYDGVRHGEADVVGDDHRQLTGEQPLSIGEVIALHGHEMPLASR
jgi:hypothetical protein